MQSGNRTILLFLQKHRKKRRRRTNAVLKGRAAIFPNAHAYFYTRSTTQRNWKDTSKNYLSYPKRSRYFRFPFGQSCAIRDSTMQWRARATGFLFGNQFLHKPPPFKHVAYFLCAHQRVLLSLSLNCLNHLVAGTPFLALIFKKNSAIEHRRNFSYTQCRSSVIALIAVYR